VRVTKSVLLDPQNIDISRNCDSPLEFQFGTLTGANMVGGGLMKGTPMADQTTRTAPEPVKPDSLTAGERAVLFNIETHTNWSDSGVVAALFEKGLVSRSGGHFALTDQGRAALDGLLQNHQRRR
jgi:hypothetical protein